MPTEAAQTGTAAHIHSASLKGPRGRGGLTDAELADPSNGIWCCATHGREIDTNAGMGYTVETLRGWKRAREEASRRERTGSSTPGAGWVDQIKIVEGPLFASGSVLNLGKATTLESDGSVGKTSFYEWLAAAAGNAIFDRWRNERVRLDIRYLEPLPHRLEVTLEEGARQYLLDNAVVHVPPTNFQVVHLQEDFFRRFFYSDDLSMISGALSIDPSIVRSLAPEIVRNGSGFFQRLVAQLEVVYAIVKFHFPFFLSCLGGGGTPSKISTRRDIECLRVSRPAADLWKDPGCARPVLLADMVTAVSSTPRAAASPGASEIGPPSFRCRS
jgi:hypothetical protein